MRRARYSSAASCTPKIDSIVVSVSRRMAAERLEQQPCHCFRTRAVARFARTTTTRSGKSLPPQTSEAASHCRSSRMPQVPEARRDGSPETAGRHPAAGAHISVRASRETLAACSTDLRPHARGIRLANPPAMRATIAATTRKTAQLRHLAPALLVGILTLAAGTLTVGARADDVEPAGSRPRRSPQPRAPPRLRPAPTTSRRSRSTSASS